VKTYDLAVIGAGSGGVRAARIAASLGAKVVLAEESRVGGTCVMRGCVPKKLLVYASRFAVDLQESRGFGWAHEPAVFNWRNLATSVNKELDRLETAYTQNLLSAGVHIVPSRAELLASGCVKYLATGEIIRAQHILIATGARPTIDEQLPGRELCNTSDDVFAWDSQPRRVLIQGAGYIAIEFACLLARLGSEVTVVCRGSHILRGFDDDLRHHLQSELQAAGITFIPRQTLRSVRRDQSHLDIELSSGSHVAADAVICALGRQPNTRHLGLETAGVRIDARGAIVVDEHFRTSAPGVFAVGDVANPVQLTPMAIREGHGLAQALFGRGPAPVRPSLIPTAVFTTPELGTVGLTEEQAITRYGDVDVYCAKFRPMKSALSGRQGQCFFKLIVNRVDDRVLGAHVIAPEAGELIQLLSVPLNMGARKSDLDATLPVHPTLAEEILTMRTPIRRHGRSEAA
jgi:glutathione reductase (NADPH)